MTARSLSLTERFMEHIIPEPNSGCWLWLGAVTGSALYGSFCMEGRNIGAHRAAYILLVGPIPDGKILMHTCDQRTCCNPDHLRACTIDDNNQDMARKSRGRKSLRGLPRGVSEKDQRYYARVLVGKRHRRWLGSFPSAELAADAITRFEREHSVDTAEGRK